MVGGWVYNPISVIATHGVAWKLPPTLSYSVSKHRLAIAKNNCQTIALQSPNYCKNPTATRLPKGKPKPIAQQFHPIYEVNPAHYLGASQQPENNCSAINKAIVKEIVPAIVQLLHYAVNPSRSADSGSRLASGVT